VKIKLDENLPRSLGMWLCEMGHPRIQLLMNSSLAPRTIRSGTSANERAVCY